MGKAKRLRKAAIKRKHERRHVRRLRAFCRRAGVRWLEYKEKYPIIIPGPIKVMTPDPRPQVGIIYGLIHLAGGLPVVPIIYTMPVRDGVFKL